MRSSQTSCASTSDKERVWKLPRLQPPTGFTLGRVGQGFSNELTAAIATTYLLSRGLSFSIIGAIWAVYLISSGLLNIPTGALADRFGRRNLYAVGMILLGAGQIGYGLAHSPLQFMLSSATFGIGSAAAIGSLQAWMVDEQLGRGLRHTIPRIFANAQSLTALAGIAAGLYVGLIYCGPLHGIYFLSGGLFAGTGLLTLALLHENRGHQSKRLAVIVLSVGHYVRSLPLLLITYVTTTVYAAYMAFLFSWQPRALAMGWEPARLGLMYAIYLALLSMGSYIYGRAAGRIRGYMGAQIISSLLIGIGLYVLITSPVMWRLLAGIGLFALGYGAFIPISSAWANEHTPSHMRASVISVLTTVALFASAILQMGMGVAIDRWGMTAAAIIGCGLTLSGLAAVAAFYRLSATVRS